MQQNRDFSNSCDELNLKNLDLNNRLKITGQNYNALNVFLNVLKKQL